MTNHLKKGSLMKKKIIFLSLLLLAQSTKTHQETITDSDYLDIATNRANTSLSTTSNHSDETLCSNKAPFPINPKKHTTVFIYMADDNDLHYFAKKNLEDMKKIGSTPFLNIVVQVDGQGPYEKTKRFYVEKNNLVQVNKKDSLSEKKLDFGNAQTLIDGCLWAMQSYPADHHVLVLWNHGIGILDSIGGKTSNASELFIFNSETNLLEINRTINFIEYAKQREEEKEQRGICFSDTFGTYLTNQKLIYALSSVQRQMNGEKFDIIAFDACLMAMLEVGDLLAPYANIMVGSQELELGAGYPYHKIFEPFLTRPLEPQELAKHIVDVYSNNYKAITNDYTLSAADLTQFQDLEDSLENVAQLLIEALKNQKNSSVYRLIQASKNRRLCTCFSEPTYIDLYDFLTNLSESIEYMLIQPQKIGLKEQLKTAIQETKEILERAVFANQVGRNLERARGLSVYFPHRMIDPSYLQTPFATKHSWLKLIKSMI
jgi:hypothetical protein